MTKIKEMEYKLLSHRSERKIADEEYHCIHKLWVQKIETEYQENKPERLSNAQKRAYAVEQRIKEDNNAQVLKEEIKYLEKEIAMLEIDLGFERREFMRYYADTLYQAGTLLGAVVPRY